MKGEGKSSYKVNLKEDQNRLYNREPIKLLKSKAIKKEREKQKLEKIKGFTHRKWLINNSLLAFLLEKFHVLSRGLIFFVFLLFLRRKAKSTE